MFTSWSKSSEKMSIKFKDARKEETIIFAR
jgi:hypothetical protein